MAPSASIAASTRRRDQVGAFEGWRMDILRGRRRCRVCSCKRAARRKGSSRAACDNFGPVMRDPGQLSTLVVALAFALAFVFGAVAIA
jgi:hypothetical protein